MNGKRAEWKTLQFYLPAKVVRPQAELNLQGSHRGWCRHQRTARRRGPVTFQFHSYVLSVQEVEAVGD